MRHNMQRISAPPSARAAGLVVERIDDEVVIYDLETKEAHCLRPLAAVVFEQCDGTATVDEIATVAEKQLAEPVSAEAVASAVAQLEELGLLAVPMVVVNGNGNGDGDRDGLSRRDMLRRAGYTGAAVAAAPLVTSIVAPTAAMAQSGIATGCAGCGKNSDCVSNHCCQDNAGKHCNQGCCVGANNSCHACPTNCGPAPAPPCQCTVLASEIPGGCPCICGAPGCVNVPCCPTQNLSCCVQQSPC
jgi:hypothetical protein